MIRRLVLLILAFALSLQGSPLLAAAPDCPSFKELGLRGSILPTAYEMSDVICKAAKDGRLQPTADSIGGNCEAGIMEGLQSFASGIAARSVEFKDLAASGANQIKEYVQHLWETEPDPAKAAEGAAQANATSAKGWLTMVRDFFEASQLLIQTFYQELKQNAELVGSSLACLPAKFVSELVCQAVSQMALEFASVKAVAVAVGGAAKAAKALKLVKDFNARMKTIESLKGLPLEATMKAAADALQEQSEYKVVTKLGNGELVSRIDPINHDEVLYFKETAMVNGKPVTSLRELVKDVKTRAIDANFQTGNKVARLSAQEFQGSHLVFFDINNLGKVNYFANGTKSGDDYLQAVADAIYKNVRSGDQLYKNGGDELVLILKTKDPAEVKAVMTRIHESIQNDSKLQNMFKQERIAKAQSIKRDRTVGGQKAPVTDEQKQALQETARIRPSVSAGAAKISGDLKSDIGRANKIADVVKARYKAKMGADVTKYNLDTGDDLFTGRPNFKALPDVPEPAGD